MFDFIGYADVMMSKAHYSPWTCAKVLTTWNVNSFLKYLSVMDLVTILYAP